MIASFRIRYISVDRGIPSRAAAPRGPAITQLDSFMAFKICSRSHSFSVTGVATFRLLRSSGIGHCRTRPAVRITELISLISFGPI